MTLRPRGDPPPGRAGWSRDPDEKQRIAAGTGDVLEGARTLGATARGQSDGWLSSARSVGWPATQTSVPVTAVTGPAVPLNWVR